LKLLLCLEAAGVVGGIGIFVLEVEGKLVCCCKFGCSPRELSRKGN
jgi:hypothetical protein